MGGLRPSDFVSFDVAILAILEPGNTAPLPVIDNEVNLSTAVVRHRVRQLEEDGVISYNVAVICPERAGRR